MEVSSGSSPPADGEGAATMVVSSGSSPPVGGEEIVTQNDALGQALERVRPGLVNRILYLSTLSKQHLRELAHFVDMLGFVPPTGFNNLEVGARDPPSTDPACRSPGAGPDPSPTLASSTSVGSQAANAKVDEEEALQLLDKATPAELAAQARALERARSNLARRLAREERNAKKPRVLEPPPYTPPVLGVASCSCLQQPCPVHADPKSFKYHHDMSRMRSHSWVRTV